MMIKSHLAITLFFVLVLLPFVNNKIPFIIVALIATFIPDIDSKNSKLGRKWIFRPLQLIMKHRGIIHSFSLLALISVFFVLFIPVLALGFFLGYSSHLLADSFTLEGIRPFYPFKGKASWKLRTGSSEETLIFILFVIIDLVLILTFFL